MIYQSDFKGAQIDELLRKVQESDVSQYPIKEDLTGEELVSIYDGENKAVKLNNLISKNKNNIEIDLIIRRYDTLSPEYRLENASEFAKLVSNEGDIVECEGYLDFAYSWENNFFGGYTSTEKVSFTVTGVKLQENIIPKITCTFSNIKVIERSDENIPCYDYVTGVFNYEIVNLKATYNANKYNYAVSLKLGNSEDAISHNKAIFAYNNNLVGKNIVLLDETSKQYYPVNIINDTEAVGINNTNINKYTIDKTANTVVLTQTTDLNDFEGGSTGPDTSCVNITYDELKSLSDNSQLIPGKQYRIIDYETRVTGSDIQSAGHVFDLIVTAISPDKIDHRCKAIHSDRDVDGYFNNSDLTSWEIWYTLDSKDWVWVPRKGRGYILDLSGDGSITMLLYYDGIKNNQHEWSGNISIEGIAVLLSIYTESDNLDTIIGGKLCMANQCMDMNTDEVSSFTQAIIDEFNNEIGGTGYIYRMIDEFGNDCPYDFKNIQYLTTFEVDSYYGRKAYHELITTTSELVDEFVYTFSYVDHNDNTWYDMSLHSPSQLDLSCKNNKIYSPSFDKMTLPYVTILNTLYHTTRTNSNYLYGPVESSNNTFTDCVYTCLFCTNNSKYNSTQLSTFEYCEYSNCVNCKGSYIYGCYLELNDCQQSKIIGSADNTIEKLICFGISSSEISGTGTCHCISSSKLHVGNSEVHTVSDCELTLYRSYVRDCHNMNCEHSITNGNLYSVRAISTSTTGASYVYLYNFSLTGSYVNIIFDAGSANTAYYYNNNIDVSRTNNHMRLDITLTPTNALTDRFVKYNGTNVISYSSSDLYKDIAQIIV